MPTTHTDRREDPFSSDHEGRNACPKSKSSVLYHPKVGVLKLGVSDFNLWQGYRPGAQPQPHFKTTAGLYATFLREDAQLGKNFQIAFAVLEGKQALRKAMGIPQPGGPNPTKTSE